MASNITALFKKKLTIEDSKDGKSITLYFGKKRIYRNELTIGLMIHGEEAHIQKLLNETGLKLNDTVNIMLKK